MAFNEIKETDKYVGYSYQILTLEELREAHDLLK